MPNLTAFYLTKIFALCLLLSLLACSGSQQLTTSSDTNKDTDLPEVEREFRAAWIASVANINWPSKPGLSVEEQKQEAIEMLNFLQKNNFNAVILQVRPQCDALYASELEPWSYYLTGTQGKAPEPFYDPLVFWIEEAHKRALELHAWLNPYRAHHVDGGPIGEQSIVNTKSNLVVKLESGFYWLDPTDPGTQEHSYNVVMDIVNRYDVDGIHFDDYFYPYPSYNNDKDFPDTKNWQNYLDSGGKLSKADWRRNAVDTFVENLYKGIKKTKKHVKFGLSPFGIWRPNHPASIKGFDQYNELYADAKLWLNKGWIDYFTPQLYWPINKIPQSYPVLLGWWAEQNYQNRHLWPGISIGRLNNNPPGEEVINQIMIARGMLPKSPGIVHWNIGGFLKSEELTKAVVQGPYKQQALIPSSKWLDPSIPENPIVNNNVKNETIEIQWNRVQPDIRLHVIYAKFGDSWTYEIVSKDEKSHTIPIYKIQNSELILLQKIAVSSVNSFGNESQVHPIDVSEAINAQIPKIGLLSPVNKLMEKTKESINGILISESTADLNSAIEKITKANYNTIFVEHQTKDKLKTIIDLAHSKGLKVCLVADDTNFLEIAKSNDIDGILFNNYIPDKSALIKILLYKPYMLYGHTKSTSSSVNALSDTLYMDFLIGEPKAYKEGSALPIVDQAQFPLNLKKGSPEQFVGLDFSIYLQSKPNTKNVTINGADVPLDENNWAYFLNQHQDSIQLQIGNEKWVLNTEEWVIPFKYQLQQDGTIRRAPPWVEFRKIPHKNNTKASFNLLAKTDADAIAKINHRNVKVYKTGVFFDKLDFKKGSNRMRADITSSNGSSTFYELNINYDSKKDLRPTFPLWIDIKTFSPDVDLENTSNDEVHIQFEGSKGQEARVELVSTGLQYPCSREDHDDSSTYRVTIPMDQVKKLGTYSFLVRMNNSTLFPVKKTVTIKNPSEFPFIRTITDNTRLTYNLGPVRLGGPIRTELDKGIVLKVIGSEGNYFKVKLNAAEIGIIRKEAVEVLSENYNLSPYFITNILTRTDENTDVVIIPYLSPIPYEIIPQPNQKRIVIRLFGAKTSSTWISHFADLKVVDKVTWQQTDPVTYEIYVNLKSENIWGYELAKEKNSLQLKIKHAPQFKHSIKKPLKGLKIVIEAGHGGKSIGSKGLSGTKEKNINLALALVLGETLENKGAIVSQVRATDMDISLLKKRAIAEQSEADLFVSIHANSAGGHYLRVSGTSTYYHNPFWKPFAKNVYDRLLETGLPEFGMVGSFNYTPIRTSKLPAILVEQAFLSHAEDEEKLVDPKFRKLMAQKITTGIIDYINHMIKNN